MAFARLARVSPIHGLYINFIPTLIYAIIGTSRHASIGNNDTVVSEPVDYTALDIAVSAAMLEGLFLLMMGVLRLGFVSVYLSDQLVGGFTTGIAVHVFTSQFPALFGLTVSGHHGPGQLIAVGNLHFATDYSLSADTCIVDLCGIFLHHPPDQLGNVCRLDGVYRFSARRQTAHRSDCETKIACTTTKRIGRCYRWYGGIVLCRFAKDVQAARCRQHSSREFFAYGGMNCIGAVFQSWPAGNSLSRILVYEGAVQLFKNLALSNTLIYTVKPKLYKRCGIDIERYKQKQQSAAAGKNASPDKKNNSETAAMPEIELHHIVIDCSGFSYVDLMGVNVMKQVYNEMHELGITVFFANCNPSVRRILFKANFFDVVPKEYVFVTLHDAVLAALKLDRIHSSRSLVEMERLVNAITESSVDDTVKL
ncbi:prestin [Trichinella spiralis]|uniref:prestin n=1 Tax=Trichinella spiralis TaxID=6334 RepID=UPI0001EFC81E|nr:prestin [Trichinella spiralis]